MMIKSLFSFVAKTLVMGALLFISIVSAAQPIAVVVNINNTDNISQEMIKQIYSDKRNFWSSGEKIELFELPVKDRVREEFSKALLNKSAIASQSDWSNRFVKNTIKNKVKMKPQRLVAKFVSVKKNAIGYIPLAKAKAQPNIKIILTIDE